MNHTKLTRTDEAIFDLLDDRMTTTEVIASIRFVSRNTVLQSLRRMDLLGLVTQTKGERHGFAQGQGESTWQRKAVDFPGVPRRKSPEREEPIGPGEIPVQSRRAGTLPDWVVGRVGLAGLVAQISS